MAIIAVLASVGLMLVVVLAFAMSGPVESNSDQRTVSSTNTVRRTQQKSVNSGPASVARPARVPQTRAPRSNDVNSSVAKPSDASSAESADDLAMSRVIGSPNDDSSRAKAMLEANSTAQAKSLESSQRSVAAVPTSPNAELPGKGKPEDYQHTVPEAAAAENEPKELSLAEKRRLAEIAKLKKMIQRQFIGQRRTSDRSRGKTDDYFVVAKYEMPLATRLADLRFEVTATLENSVDQVAEYLTNTPTGVLRDYQVVARFGSMAEAEEGIIAVRQQYDQAKEYQAQLLAYLQEQQRFQASSMRRC